VVLADRVQLQQLIINLVINGIEAMQPVTDRPRELMIRLRFTQKSVRRRCRSALSRFSIPRGTHARAQYAEDTANRIVFDETAEPVLRQPARFGDPWNLAQRRRA